VVSSIVEMTPAVAALTPDDLKSLSTVARLLFSSRRKTIRNNAKSDALREALNLEGIAPGLRAEQLPPPVFVRLARRLTGSSSP
jgi:16S rRNA A1518/A1519 N6-dimethyltransferase RsmA/KsgA/DIM1 with predicted DNA glycosylase/AP lyase activity